MFGLHILDIATIIAYFMITAGIGFYAIRKVKNQSDFFIGSRKFGKFLFTMQQFGTGTANSHPIVVAGAVYAGGMSGIWWSWVYMLITPLYFLTAPMIRRLRVTTTPEFVEMRFGSGLQAFYSLSAIAFVAVYVGTLLVGMGQLVEGISGGQIPRTVTVLLTSAFFLCYGIGGGLYATVFNDVIQGFLIVVLSFILIPPGLVKVGGMANLHHILKPEHFSLALPASGTGTGLTFDAIIMLSILSFVGNWVEPATFQYGGIAKDETSTGVGVICGAMLKRVCTVGWAFVGLIGIALFPELGPGKAEQVWGKAASALLPTGLLGLMIASMLAAAMGACSAFTICGSAIFTRNFYKKYLVKDKPEKHYLTVGRIATIFVVAMGVIISMRFKTVLEIFELWWAILSFFGISFTMGLFWRRTNRRGAWTSFFAATATYIWVTHSHLWFTFGMNIQREYERAMYYLPVGFAVCIIVSLLTPSEDKRKLDEFYLRIMTPVKDSHKLKEAGINIEVM
jgi:SSS family transporter